MWAMSILQDINTGLNSLVFITTKTKHIQLFCSILWHLQPYVERSLCVCVSVLYPIHPESYRHAFSDQDGRKKGMKTITRILVLILISINLVIAIGCAQGQPANSNNQNSASSNQNPTSNNQNTAAIAQGNANASETRQKANSNSSKAVGSGAGSIEVTSTPPRASVILISLDEDGAEPEPRGFTPTTLNDIPVGKYTVNIELPGYKYFQKNIKVTEGKTIKVTAPLRKE